MVISSSMTYGLNVVALTKSNRTRLRRYEREILKAVMLQAVRKRTRLKTQELLEEKTIINIIKEEWATLVQNKTEIKKAAEKLHQHPETDTESSAPSEENKE
ncbi:hypothetical protein EVAR_95186_1 [Eumeta japonica]|uniref:Uncharacterized protein n=1 Tax=Eumeta variegata TaxID=151549 RepID=A0A4C1VHI3_EUMVA|nr:hypothetical protein EVAR_95186_1 [Eumeta japonica]